jgi:hypothetical protein
MADDEHRISAVHAVEGGYVVACSCGWRSGVLENAAEIEYAWSRHVGVS